MSYQDFCDANDLDPNAASSKTLYAYEVANAGRQALDQTAAQAGF